jgi:NADPH2:quinone reductase
VPEPPEVADEVRVRVAAAGVTFPDLLATRGRYQLRPDPPFAPGLEVAGTVVSAPAGSGLRPGQSVAALTWFGGFAEVVSVPPEQVVALPDGLDPVIGAALLVNHLTAHFALVHRAAARPGEVVLVHGAAGGLGSASLQVAKHLGLRTLAVTSTPEKAAVARACGADDVLSAGDFLAEATALLGPRGVDVVVDPVGGDRFLDSVRTLGPDGRLLVLGFADGEIPTVRTNRLLLGNAGVLGVAWAEYLRVVPGHLHWQWEQVLPAITSGAYRPHVSQVLPLEDAADALRRIEDRTATGKIVLTLA